MIGCYVIGALMVVVGFLVGVMASSREGGGLPNPSATISGWVVFSAGFLLVGLGALGSLLEKACRHLKEIANLLADDEPAGRPGERAESPSSKFKPSMSLPAKAEEKTDSSRVFVRP